MLIYPVITMGPGTHQGSHDGLLGRQADPALVELYSNEKQVKKTNPPAFLFGSTADRTVQVTTNEDVYAAALKDAGVPYEYLRGNLGGHGVALDPGEKWSARLRGMAQKAGIRQSAASVVAACQDRGVGACEPAPIFVKTAYFYALKACNRSFGGSLNAISGRFYAKSD